MRPLATNPVPFVRLFSLVALSVFLLEFDNAAGADSRAAKDRKKKGFVTIATIGSGRLRLPPTPRRRKRLRE